MKWPFRTATLWNEEGTWWFDVVQGLVEGRKGVDVNYSVVGCDVCLRLSSQWLWGVGYIELCLPPRVFSMVAIHTIQHWQGQLPLGGSPENNLSLIIQESPVLMCPISVRFWEWKPLDFSPKSSYVTCDMYHGNHGADSWISPAPIHIPPTDAHRLKVAVGRVVLTKPLWSQLLWREALILM